MVLAMQILLLCVCEYKFDHGLAPMMMGSGDKERLPLMPYNITIYADLEYIFQTRPTTIKLNLRGIVSVQKLTSMETMTCILLFMLMILTLPMRSIKRWAAFVLKILRWVFISLKTPMDTGLNYFLRENKVCLLYIILLGTLLINGRDSIAGSDYNLPPCPSSPNCVSSQGVGKQFVEPFSITGDTEVAFARLKEMLERRKNTSIVIADDRVIRVEFKTMLGFVDGGLFVLDIDNSVILIRSASRFGYWDFGKNRRRLETIRQVLTPGKKSADLAG